MGEFAGKVAFVTGAGFVRPNAPVVRVRMLANAHASPSQARQPISLLQLVAGGDPACRYDVRPLPLSLRNVEDLLFERRILTRKPATPPIRLGLGPSQLYL